MHVRQPRSAQGVALVPATIIFRAMVLLVFLQATSNAWPNQQHWPQHSMTREARLNTTCCHQSAANLEPNPTQP
jgi:hypothetical protein